MANNNVMNEMVGKWKLEKRDNNFDEFLSCRQVGWFLRKLMTSSVADVEYSLSQDANTFTKVIVVHKYFAVRSFYKCEFLVSQFLRVEEHCCEKDVPVFGRSSVIGIFL